MEDKIFKIMYVSSAPFQITDDELMDSLAVSRKNNQALNITGILLYFDGNFFQLLEGEADNVRALYSKIAVDRRHTGVIKLLEQVSDKRDFPEWSMGFKRLNGDEESLSGFLDIVQDSERIQTLLDATSKRTQLLIDTFKNTSGISKII